MERKIIRIGDPYFVHDKKKSEGTNTSTTTTSRCRVCMSKSERIVSYGMCLLCSLIVPHKSSSEPPMEFELGHPRSFHPREPFPLMARKSRALPDEYIPLHTGTIKELTGSDSFFPLMEIHSFFPREPYTFDQSFIYQGERSIPLDGRHLIIEMDGPSSAPFHNGRLLSPPEEERYRRGEMTPDERVSAKRRLNSLYGCVSHPEKEEDDEEVKITVD